MKLNPQILQSKTLIPNFPAVDHHLMSHVAGDDDDQTLAPPLPPSPLSSFLLRDPDDDDDDPDDDDDYDEETLIQDLKPSTAPPSIDPNPGTNPNSVASPAVVIGHIPRIDPAPHISLQFYTFNPDSHALMVRCLLESRFATAEEIRQVTQRSVLESWRSVWKDRNEDTAYATAWKRLQEKLQAGFPDALFFKNHPAQRISHVGQWQDIVFANHGDPDLLQHLGLKETVDRIKQSWTVGAKLFGIPESFIRVCVAACPVCSSSSGCVGSAGGSASARSKRRRFEYTDSIDVPAREVQQQLHQLAVKHKAVLCIRQKYVRYKPFMAEVKDYACHRAGKPTALSNSAKKARVLKREPYQSKRCGCGFRIRAIVPINNYNEKDKTFVYDEEGTAVFKLYAVHSGHEPGPLDGNARIIHRMVGNKLSYELNPEIYGVMEDSESDSYIGLMGKDDGGVSHHIVSQQLQELKIETKLLEAKLLKMPMDMMDSLSLELSDIIYRLRNFGGGFQNSKELARSTEDDEVSHCQNVVNHHLDGHGRMFGKDAEIIDDDDTDFGSNLGSIVPWEGLNAECQDRNMLLRQGLKPEKWMMKEDCGGFDEKSILHCGEDEEEAKLMKPVSEPNLVGMQVDGFYSVSSRWYDSPGGLDPSIDSGDGGFRHGRIV